MRRTAPSPFWRGRAAETGRPAADDPFAAMRSLVDRAWPDMPAGWPSLSTGDGGFLSPEVDVSETDDGLEVKADLPGLSPADVSLELRDGVLTLRAEREAEREEKDEKRKWHLVERSRGTYLRRIALPFAADEDRIEARFEKGVLTVKVPRAADQPSAGRRIDIAGG